MRIGVFGGTFDPIHFGHLTVAQSVRSTLSLAKVVFVPAGQPWLKAETLVSPATDRVEMVRLAIRRQKGFELSTIEADKLGPSYTVDTMETLQKQLGPETELFFLLGSDALQDLPKWKEPQRLVQICRLVAFGRPGCKLPDLKPLEMIIPGLSSRITFLEVPQVDISATEVRRRRAEGKSIRRMVPRSVEQYILEHGLYRAGRL